jgi:F-type H+-transporting ATPase subunit alpha
LLKQPQYKPMATEDQVVTIFAGVRGYLDKLAVGDIGRFEQAMLSELKTKHADILTTIASEKAISPATEEKLKSALEAVAKSFA